MAVLEGNHPFVALTRASYLRLQDRYPEAIAIVESVPDTPETFGGRRGASKAATLGAFYAAVRLTERAQAIVDELKDEYLFVILTGINADLYARAARTDLAAPLLDRVLASPMGGLAYSPPQLPIDPSFDPIREDPLFIALLEKYPPSGGEANSATPLPAVTPAQ